MDNNDLDIALAKSVGEYFRFNIAAKQNIILEVQQSIKQWEVIANEIGIARIEQEIMRGAFKS
jgi:serine/threonine-protein kinase HipA